MRNRFITISFLVLAFIITSIVPAFAADDSTANFTDIDKHWAKGPIVEWVYKNLIKGYPDGTFKPDNSITRAEFMALANRALGRGEKTDVTFPDVSQKDWFYEDVATALATGYISGYPDGTVKPQQNITRQEAATALCKALELAPEVTAAVEDFSDAKAIPDWSKSYIGAVVAKGYMGGYPDKSFGADKPITRAETVVVLDRIIKARTATYDTAGIFGPEKGTETIPGDVAIDVEGVTLRNLVIEGNLYLNEGIGEGDVTLDNVIVKKNTFVFGGGKDSIHLTNFTTAELIVIKVGGKVRIVTAGDTSIENLILESGAHIEGNGIATVTVLKPGEDVILDGDFEEVIVKAEAKVEVMKGTTVNKLQVDSKAEINLDKDAKVRELTLDAPANISGKGTVETAKINASGASLETKPEQLEMAKDVTATIAGKEVKESTNPESGGGGGGGGNVNSTEAYFREKARSAYDIEVDGDKVATVAFDKDNYTLDVTFIVDDREIVTEAGKTFFNEVLADLGVKSVSIGDEEISVIPDNVLTFARKLFKEMGIDTDLKNFDAKSTKFDATIGFSGYSDIQKEFTVTFHKSN